MEYSILHLSTLIDLMLVQAKLPRNYSGLTRLLEHIEEKLQLKEERNSRDYLYKAHLRIQEALEKKTPTIKFKESYLEECCHFLNYEAFHEVEEKLKQVEQQFSSIREDLKQIKFLIPDQKKNSLAESITESKYPSQGLDFETSTYDEGDCSWMTSFDKLSIDRTIIWMISKTLFQKYEAEVKSKLNDKQIKNVLPFWITDKIGDLAPFQETIDLKYALKGEEDLTDLYILIQLIIRNKISCKGSNEKRKKKSKSVTFNNNVTTNTGFVIGQLKSKDAPQIHNHFYESKESKNEH